MKIVLGFLQSERFVPREVPSDQCAKRAITHISSTGWQEWPEVQLLCMTVQTTARTTGTGPVTGGD
jgi:hypothetical protein